MKDALRLSPSVEQTQDEKKHPAKMRNVYALSHVILVQAGAEPIMEIASTIDQVEHLKTYCGSNNLQILDKFNPLLVDP